MSKTITQDEVVSAARELDQSEFTRADLAEKLNVERKELKDGFKAARQSGDLEKIRNDENGTGLFKLTAE